MPDQRSLMAINLFVADMSASLAFYRHLGLDVPEARPDSIHVEIPVAEGVVLELDTIGLSKAYDSGWQDPSGPSRCSFQYLLPAREAVDALYGDLTGAGYHGRLAPFDAFWGARYATVEDPDGNLVSLTSGADPAFRGPLPEIAG